MATITLNGRLEKNQGLFATVDDQDLPLVEGHKWYAHRVKGSLTIYAKAKIAGHWVFMHHLIVGKRRRLEVDHRDGNGLRNERANLRHVTHAVNLRHAFERRREREFSAWFEEQMQTLSDESQQKVLQNMGRPEGLHHSNAGKTPTKSSWCGQEDSNLHPLQD